MFWRRAEDAVLKTSFIAFLGIAFICGIPKAGIAVSITFDESEFQVLPNLASLTGKSVGGPISLIFPQTVKDAETGEDLLVGDYLARDARFTEDNVGFASTTPHLGLSFSVPVSHVILDVLTIGGVYSMGLDVTVFREFGLPEQLGFSLPPTEPSRINGIAFNEHDPFIGSMITGLSLNAATGDAETQVGIDCITFTTGEDAPSPDCPVIPSRPRPPPIDCITSPIACSGFLVLPIGTVEPESIPEPATIFLLGSSLLGLFIYWLRRRKNICFDPLGKSTACPKYV
jgi:hypothetical protein